ncbi:hypothetical protein PG985_005338 [Apiospora marii]|uniref:uncharacterized protein n=1 Tax=Apiospora marii TaxID=335849 RepID=UPI0031315276
MSFMTLPAELRGLIYHAFLTDNAPCQHVIPVSGGIYAHYARFPCQAIPDHEFLQNLSRCCGLSGWGDYLETMRFSEWRGGHLACEPGTLFHRSERLPSPLPLFLTCRQVYREAAVYLHGAPLIINTTDAFAAFTGPKGWDTSLSVATVQLVVDPVRRRDGGYGVDREFVRRLVRLDLSSVRLTTLGPVDADRARWLLQALSGRGGGVRGEGVHRACQSHRDEGGGGAAREWVPGYDSARRCLGEGFVCVGGKGGRRA